MDSTRPEFFGASSSLAQRLREAQLNSDIAISIARFSSPENARVLSYLFSGEYDQYKDEIQENVKMFFDAYQIDDKDKQIGWGVYTKEMQDRIDEYRLRRILDKEIIDNILSKAPELFIKIIEQLQDKFDNFQFIESLLKKGMKLSLHNFEKFISVELTEDDDIRDLNIELGNVLDLISTSDLEFYIENMSTKTLRSSGKYILKVLDFRGDKLTDRGVRIHLAYRNRMEDLHS